MSKKHLQEQFNPLEATSSANQDVKACQGVEVMPAEHISPSPKEHLKLLLSEGPTTQKKAKTETSLRSKKRKRGKPSNATTPVKRLEELDDEQLKIFADRNTLVNLIQQGVKVKEAIRRVGLKCTEKTARNLVRRKSEKGTAGLIDRRWSREPEAYIFTPEVKAITLSCYLARPAAGHRAIWKMACKECRRLNLKEPCETTVKDFLSNLEPAFKLFRKGKLGKREWQQTGMPVVRYENTSYANQLWQGDHSPLRIWVRVEVFNKWEPSTAHITTLLDADSRAVPGYAVSTKHPDAWVIALTFWRAIMPKPDRPCEICGIPESFETDRGSDFLSDAIAATLAGLGTIHIPDPPYYPNNKGKVERFFRTLDSGCLRVLPGHMDAIGSTPGAAMKHVHELLTLPQLDYEIARWLDEDYHLREHSETGRAPAEHWKQTVRLSMPKSEDDLNLLLLKYDRECTVLNTGIKFTLNGVKHRYWCPQLAYYWKRRVKLRYNPEDMHSVRVYCAATNEFLCEAFDLQANTPRFTVTDVKRARSQYRRGLLERMPQYMRVVFDNDRNATGRLEIAARKREMLEQDAPAHALGDAVEEKSAKLHDLLTLFRRQDSEKE
jgi:putative transposase